jgi:hypothetical protein
MHDGWQLFSPTLLVEVEGSLLKSWVALYALTSVWRMGEREKHMRSLARLARSVGAWRGMARRGDGRGRMTCV